MDEFTRWPKPFALLPTIFDEILSWMTRIWMNNHLMIDNIHNTTNL